MARKTPTQKKPPTPPIAGRYQLVRSLGKGGGGEVYLVQDLHEGERLVAIKRVKGTAVESPILADLKNEFATLSLLHHPNLAEVFDFGVTEQEMFFTSEWVDGRDILEATSHADLNTVFHLVVQILRALDFLHQRGVLHLDLKPANILVTDPNRKGELSVKLIDFGIAQWKRQGRIKNAGFSGSPPYAAPELIQEKEASTASDIYSLGMLFHQIFAGRFPFPTQNPLEILMRQTYEDPQRVEQLDPALPPPFADLLHRMVARDPAVRFSSAREVLDEINDRLGENFSLRSPQAPAHILEESDHFFHPEILEALAARVAQKERSEVTGPPGAGKTRLLERLKAQLQLQGKRPFYFRESPAWEEFLVHPSGTMDRPVLLDLKEAPPANAALAKISAALLWTSRSPSPPGPPGETIPLPALDEKKLAQFFQAEIREAPEGIARTLLQSAGPIFPGKLEAILQAMREEGNLAWGPGGWNWQGETPIDAAALLERKAIREQEKKRELREFLEGSGLALPAPVLEGMLGFEAGALRDSIQDWTREGWLQAEIQKGVTHYAVPSRGEEAAAGAGGDPEAAAQQLNVLYEQGKFAAGIAWVDQWEKQAAPNHIPPRIALVGGRHLVAEGQAERALQLLKPLSFATPEEQALLFETRARGENLLAHMELAKAALAESEKYYLAAGSTRGLARVYNLRGILFRAERRWAESEEYLQKAVQHAVQAGDLYCAGLAQTNLALVYQEQGKVEAAYAGYQQAWDFARRETHPFLLQSLYQKWINLLHHGGRSAEAEAACYEWMKLAIRHHYRDQQAIALNYLSLIAGKKGHLELKANYLDQAIVLLDGKKQPRFRAQFLVNRAYLHWSRGNFFPAQLDAEAALEIGRRWPEERLMGWINIILGKIYRDRPKPDWVKSAELFNQAFANIQKNRTFESLWEVEYNRGLLAKVRGDLGQAEQYFLAAKRALEDFLEKLPEPLRGSYLRDRKLESVVQELESLTTS